MSDTTLNSLNYKYYHVLYINIHRIVHYTATYVLMYCCSKCHMYWCATEFSHDLPQPIILLMCSEGRSGSIMYKKNKNIEKNHLGWVNERRKFGENLAPKNLTCNKGKIPYTYLFLRRNREATPPIIKIGGVQQVFVSLPIYHLHR